MRRPRTQVPDWAILALVCLAQFMVVLDVSIVTVALPAMGRDLGLSSTGLQWVLNAYAIAFAGFLLLGGRAADLYGRRRVFLVGLTLFTAASLVAGLAPTGGTLLGARLAQGFSAAILSPATLTILTTTFAEGPRRHRALGAWSALAAAGGAAGVLLGGVITDTLGWRWIFFVNGPIGVVGLVVAVMVLADADVTRHGDLDVIGAVLVTAGLIIGVYGLVTTDTHAWGSAVVLCSLAASVILLAGFVLNERSFARSPLVPLDIFAMRGVSVANIVMFLVGAAIWTSWFFLSLYMQFVLDYSPLQTGLAFIPNTLSLMVAAQVSARVVGRVGPRTLLVIGALTSAAALWLLTGLPVHGTFLRDIALPSVILTTGMGLSMTPLAVVATAGVPAYRAGLASGLVNTTRQVGGGVGLAVLATIAAHHTSHLSGSRGADAALVAGYDRAFVVAACFAVAAAAVALLLPRTTSADAQRDAVEEVAIAD